MAKRMGVHEKAVMRMVSNTGNPHAENLLALVHALKGACKLLLTVQAKPLRRAEQKAAA